MPHALLRLIFVCVSGDAASGGLDLALGLNVGATPLTGLGPAVVLEALVCGASPQAAVQGMAALPVVRLKVQNRVWGSEPASERLGYRSCEQGAQGPEMYIYCIFSACCQLARSCGLV